MCSSATAFQRYWNQIVEPLIADAGPLAGKTLKYLHTDSWEVELVNWTPTLREEFQKRRGYDLLPWLPVMAGRIVNSAARRATVFCTISARRSAIWRLTIITASSATTRTARPRHPSRMWRAARRAH